MENVKYVERKNYAVLFKNELDGKRNCGITAGGATFVLTLKYLRMNFAGGNDYGRCLIGSLLKSGAVLYCERHFEVIFYFTRFTERAEYCRNFR